MSPRDKLNVWKKKLHGIQNFNLILINSQIQLSRFNWCCGWKFTCKIVTNERNVFDKG